MAKNNTEVTKHNGHPFPSLEAEAKVPQVGGALRPAGGGASQVGDTMWRVSEIREEAPTPA